MFLIIWDEPTFEPQLSCEEPSKKDKAEKTFKALEIKAIKVHLHIVRQNDIWI